MSIDNVRLLVGDTNESDQILSDANIDFFLSEASDNVYFAASLAADAIAAKFARDVTNSQSDSHGVHSLSRSSSDKFKHYKELAGKLLTRYQQGMGGSGGSGVTASALRVFAGGISRTDKDTRDADGDRVLPAFNRQLHDNPGTAKTKRRDDNE